MYPRLLRQIGSGRWWLGYALLAAGAMAVGLRPDQRYRWLLGAVPAAAWAAVLWLAGAHAPLLLRGLLGGVAVAVLSGPLIRPLPPLRWDTHLLGSAPDSSELWSSALPSPGVVAVRRLVAPAAPPGDEWVLVVRYAWNTLPALPVAAPVRSVGEVWMEPTVNGEPYGRLRLWRDPAQDPCCVARLRLPGLRLAADSVVDIRLRQPVPNAQAALIAQRAPSFSQLGQGASSVVVDGVERPGVLHGYTGQVVPGAWHIFLDRS